MKAKENDKQYKVKQMLSTYETEVKPPIKFYRSKQDRKLQTMNLWNLVFKMVELGFRAQ